MGKFGYEVNKTFLHPSGVPILRMICRCFVRSTCLDPEISPHQGRHLNVLRSHNLSSTPASRAQPLKREQTNVDRQSQRIYYRYIQCAPATRLHTPRPQRLPRGPWGLSTTRVPHSPRRCSSQKHAGGGLPLAPPLTKWPLQLEGGGERKTVLSSDVPPIKSLRGCGAEWGRRSTFCKNKLNQDLTTWL